MTKFVLVFQLAVVVSIVVYVLYMVVLKPMARWMQHRVCGHEFFKHQIGADRYDSRMSCVCYKCGRVFFLEYYEQVHNYGLLVTKYTRTKRKNPVGRYKCK